MPDALPIVLQHIDLDIVPGKIPPIVHVSEYDTGRNIVVNLFRDGYPFGSDSIESYTVKVEGSIGKYGFSENAAWADDAEGVVVVHLTEAMTAIHGRVWTKIKLIKSETMQISTCGFWLDVDRAGVNAQDVIQAQGFTEQIAAAAGAWLEDQGFSSPTIDVAEIDGGHRLTITDYEGSESFDVMDGEDTGVVTDPTLSNEGEAADAAATGDAFATSRGFIAAVQEILFNALYTSNMVAEITNLSNYVLEMNTGEPWNVTQSGETLSVSGVTVNSVKQRGVVLALT